MKLSNNGLIALRKLAEGAIVNPQHALWLTLRGLQSKDLAECTSHHYMQTWEITPAGRKVLEERERE